MLLARSRPAERERVAIVVEVDLGRAEDRRDAARRRAMIAVVVKIFGADCYCESIVGNVLFRCYVDKR